MLSPLAQQNIFMRLVFRRLYEMVHSYLFWSERHDVWRLLRHHCRTILMNWCNSVGGPSSCIGTDGRGINHD